MIELEHSPLGASGATRWINCAGSFLLHRQLLQAGTLEVVESGYAKLGTAAHELGAMCIQQEREPYEFMGWEIGGYVVGNPDGIDPDAVAVYVAECERINPRDGKGTVYVEKTFHHPHIHPLLKGTVDFGYASPHVMHLRDYKNGEGVGVSAPGNNQMLYYGFAQAIAHPEITDRKTPVTLGIVQPNFYGIFEAPDIWETDLGTVLDYGHDVLLPRMNALMSTPEISDGDFVSGTHCQFCPVMIECPKLKRAFEEYANGEEFVAMLPDQEIDRLYSLREDARRFMNALGDVVYARKIAGSNITSAKLVEKQTRRVWKVGAEPALAQTFGPNAYDPAKLKSPASIEKLSTRGKELALEYGYKPEADRLTIAPLTDPRPEAKPPNSALIFKDFEQTPEQMGF